MKLARFQKPKGQPKGKFIPNRGGELPFTGRNKRKPNKRICNQKGAFGK
jgi:hypothetical protein